MSGKGIWFRVFCSVMLAVLLTLTAVQAAPVADDYDPNQLSYGLYWFGKNDANQKFAAGEDNPYFDPAKPTLIFVHGWQPYLSQNLPSFGFNGHDTAAAWIDAGWNVGIFVWNQFSDETTGVLGGDWFSGGPPQGVLDAEAKIWTPNGPRKMRWRDWGDLIDGYSDAPAGTPSAGQLFYQTYVEALEGYTGTIRIAGHSLGNQMAVRLTKLVDAGIAAADIPEPLRPTRVALLDPYWSPDPREDLDDSDVAGRRTGDVVREYIGELLPTGTLFEWYWSSDWTKTPNGYTNEALKPMVLYAEMDPAYAASSKDKHMAPRYLYFWSKAYPQDCTGTSDTCRLLGQMSDAQTASLMRSDYRWTQVEGQGTPTPEDDLYQATLQSDAPYTVTLLTPEPATQATGGTVTVTAKVAATSDAAPDGTLVTFASDLGTISARTAVNGGLTVAHLSSEISGTAHISATTLGAGGSVQSSAVVTFTDASPECMPLTGAAIEGPVGVSGTLYIGNLYSFKAVITPTDASEPISYTWAPTPTQGQNQDTATYLWSTPGTYTVSLTAENCGGPVAAAPRVVTVAKPAAYVGPEQVSISGPVVGLVTKHYTFTAAVAPVSATLPFTYVWQATGQVPVTHTHVASLTDSLSYAWGMTDTYAITVTAINAADAQHGTHSIVISDSLPSCPKPLTGVAIEGPVDAPGTLYVGTDYTFNAIITPTDATAPITYTWQPIPANGQNHASATYRWDAPGTYTLTLTAENCGGPVEAAPRVLTVATGEHRVYLPLLLRN